MMRTDVRDEYLPMFIRQEPRNMQVESVHQPPSRAVLVEICRMHRNYLADPRPQRMGGTERCAGSWSGPCRGLRGGPRRAVRSLLGRLWGRVNPALSALAERHGRTITRRTVSVERSLKPTRLMAGFRFLRSVRFLGVKHIFADAAFALVTLRAVVYCS